MYWWVRLGQCWPPHWTRQWAKNSTERQNAQWPLLGRTDVMANQGAYAAKGTNTRRWGATHTCTPSSRAQHTSERPKHPQTTAPGRAPGPVLQSARHNTPPAQFGAGAVLERHYCPHNYSHSLSHVCPRTAWSPFPPSHIQTPAHIYFFMHVHKSSCQVCEKKKVFVFVKLMCKCVLFLIPICI